MHDKVGAEAHQSFHFWSTGSTPNAGQCEEVLRRRRGGEALNSRAKVGVVKLRAQRQRL